VEVIGEANPYEGARKVWIRHPTPLGIFTQTRIRVSWLKKIPPLSEPSHTEHREEIEA
jgi:hypothetical protein